MKYDFIQRHRRVWPISVQCRVLEVSVAGYHEYFVRRASAAQRRHLSDDAQFDESDVASSDSIESFGVSASRGKSFRCLEFDSCWT